MELWDILDAQRNKTGRSVERGNPMEPGDYHLVVFSFIVNAQGQILISKRTPNKTFPNTWEITGGSAIAGDDSLSAITREVKEELGIELIHENGKIIKHIIHSGEFSYFADVWLFQQEVDMKDVVCQPEEVSEAKWATKDEINGLIEDHNFMVGIKELIDCLDCI